MPTVFPMYLTWNTEKPCAVDVSEIYKYEYEYEYEYPMPDYMISFRQFYICFVNINANDDGYMEISMAWQAVPVMLYY